MAVVIFEPEALIELVPAHVEVVGLEMYSSDSQIATHFKREFNCCLADAFRAMLRTNVELVDQAIATLELEREAKTQDHVSEKFVTQFEEDYSAEIRIRDQFG